MDVQIISQVDECVYKRASFATQKVDAKYTLGSADLVVKLPEILFWPDCRLDSLAIISIEALAQETPDKLPFDSIVKLEKEQLQVTILKQTSLSILDQHVYAILKVRTNVGLSISLDFSVKFDSGGPWFVSTPEVPEITCSKQDKGWSF